MSNLADLNAIRVDLGMSVLKSWKESAAKLQAQFDKLTAQKNAIIAVGPASVTMTPEEVANEVAAIEAQKIELAEEAARIARLEASAKNKPVKIKTDEAKVAKMYAPKKAQMSKKQFNDMIEKSGKKALKTAQIAAKIKVAAVAKAKDSIVNVATIAKELKINPKIARATLRRKNVDRNDEAAIRAALKK